MDDDYLESSIALGVIDNASSYSHLAEAQVRKCPESRSQELKKVVTMEKLDAIVASELQTNMRSNDATARMLGLLVDYRTNLGRHGLKWIISNNQRVAVQHVLSAAWPATLKDRLESNLSFSHHYLQKDFKGFMTHAPKLPEALQLVDAGSPSKNRKQANGNPGSSRSGNVAPPKTGKTLDGKRDESKKSLCFCEPHMKKGIRHYIRDCPGCPADEKRGLLAARAAKLAEDGPATGTSSDRV